VDNILLILPLLACPIGMGVCMWLMARGMRGGRTSEEPSEVPRSIEQLREEQLRLESEIDRLEHSRDVESPTATR
jgi:hypothetical protein